jgi:subtilase family serine protease
MVSLHQHCLRPRATTDKRLFPDLDAVPSGSFFHLAAIALLLLAGFGGYPPQAMAQEKVALPDTPVAVKNGKAQLLGPYDPSQKLRLVFGLQPPHLQDEEEFLRQVQDRDSPLFHKYLSAEEWNARFAPSVQDEQAVVDWATSQGLTITQRYPNRLLVDVEAPVAVIEQAFNVNINRYQMDGTSYFSNDRDPSIPASLAGTIHSLLGLNNFEVAHAASHMPVVPGPDYSPGPVYTVGTHLQDDSARTKPNAGLATPQNESRPANPDNISHDYYTDVSDIYSPGAYDYQALINFGHCCNPVNNPGNSPPESSIAIAIWDDFSDSDLIGFVNYVYLPYGSLAYNVQRYFIDGTPQCCGGEPTLDVEWTTATANSFGSSANTAQVHVYEGANNYYSTLLDVINQALSDGHARTLSMSWGAPELYGFSPTTMDSYHAVFNQMAGQGWTLVAAAGDQGATTGCGDYLAVSYPASDPDVVAAGGTTLQISYYGYSTETAWTGGFYGCSQNDGGTGGGCSAYFSTPQYQTNQACREPQHAGHCPQCRLGKFATTSLFPGILAMERRYQYRRA